MEYSCFWNKRLNTTRIEHSGLSEIKFSYPHYSVKPECAIRVVYIRVIRIPL